MRILFVCNHGNNRSKTAEEIFSREHETRSAGLFNDNPVTARDLTWADVVMVMTDDHRQEIAERFPKQFLSKQILSLDIPDNYSYNHPELVLLLEDRIKDHEEHLG